MSLHQKAAFVLTAAFLLSVGINFTLFYSGLVPNFVKMDPDPAAQVSLNEETDQLADLARDWAGWDDTVAFMTARDQGYISANLPFESFLENGLNLIHFYDHDGALIWGKAFDLGAREEIWLAEFPQDGPPLQDTLIRFEETQSPNAGLMATSAGAMIVAAAPIGDLANDGQVLGTLVMARTTEATPMAPPGAGGLTTPPVSAEDQAAYALLLSFVASSLLVGIATFLLLRASLLAPLSRFTQQVLGRRAPSFGATIERHDEIGALARALSTGHAPRQGNGGEQVDSTPEAPLTLAEALADALRRLPSDCKGKATLTIDQSLETAPAVQAPLGELTQVLCRVLEAAEASIAQSGRPDGQIQILSKSEMDGDRAMLRLSIMDNGSGPAPAAHLQRSAGRVENWAGRLYVAHSSGPQTGERQSNVTHLLLPVAA